MFKLESLTLKKKKKKKMLLTLEREVKMLMTLERAFNFEKKNVKEHYICNR